VTVQNTPSTTLPDGVELYDFRRPTTLAREHARVLEVAFETFARQWGTQLTAKVRVRSQVTFEGISIHTYDEYVAKLPPQTTMVLLEVDADSPAKAIMQFPAAAAIGWLARMLGGSPAENEDERKFTQIEQTMVRRLIEETIDDLTYSFAQLLPNPVSIDSIHHNSQFAQAAGTGDLMVVGTLSIAVGDLSHKATLAFPADLILGRLGDANPVTRVEDARGLLEAQVANVPVNVSLQLAPKSVTPAQIIGLSVGDMLTLNHHSTKPLNVAVEGLIMARAALGASGSRLACIVVENLENKR
jgi:flagellar motor switch protein FliM